jgi:two-component system LytT family response regulator
MSERIRALIADDEPLARERIRDLLALEQDIDVVAECVDGRSAARALHEHAPDLLFLDVQMPELDGFSVLEQAHVPSRLCIIFVTAFDQYALRAFNAHAVDYLLKPFDRDRFQVALRRARTLLAGHEQVDTRHQLLTLLHELRSQPTMGTRIPIKANGRILFLRPEQIDWLEAADNYVRVHAATDSYLVRDTLNDFEARLDPMRFARIHRSTIVNLDRVKELRPLFHGEYSVLLETGARLTLSRRYRDRLQHRFGEWL